MLQNGWSLTVSVELRPPVQGNFLKETRFCGLSKTTLRNKTAEKALQCIMIPMKKINVEIRDTK